MFSPFVLAASSPLDAAAQAGAWLLTGALVIVIVSPPDGRSRVALIAEGAAMACVFGLMFTWGADRFGDLPDALSTAAGGAGVLAYAGLLRLFAWFRSRGAQWR